MTILYEISQASRQIGVHVATLRRWIEAGKIPVTMLPSGHRRFTEEQIEEIKRGMEKRP